MSNDIIVVSSPQNNNRRIPVILKHLCIIMPDPVIFCPPPVETIAELINKKDSAMHLYDFDRIHLESKQQETDRRNRVRFQNIYANIHSKQMKQINIKKQKGK